MHYLITPLPEGSCSIMLVTGNSKQLVELEVLPQPVEIAGHTIVGYPKLTRYAMAGNRAGSAAYHMLISTLHEPEATTALADDFGKAWARLCTMAGVEGQCPILLVTDAGKILLYTFDSTAQLEDAIVTVFEFAEPTMYLQGMMLTHRAIMEQVQERRRRKDEALKRSFNADDATGGFDLHELDLE